MKQLALVTATMLLGSLSGCGSAAQPADGPWAYTDVRRWVQ